MHATLLHYNIVQLYHYVQYTLACIHIEYKTQKHEKGPSQSKLQGK